MKVEIKKDTKAHNKFAVKMELTEGAILALANGLQKHADSGLFPIWGNGRWSGFRDYHSKAEVKVKRRLLVL